MHAELKEGFKLGLCLMETLLVTSQSDKLADRGSTIFRIIFVERYLGKTRNLEASCVSTLSLAPRNVSEVEEEIMDTSIS